jgi:hypothetical protein
VGEPGGVRERILDQALHHVRYPTDGSTREMKFALIFLLTIGSQLFADYVPKHAWSIGLISGAVIILVAQAISDKKEQRT